MPGVMASGMEEIPAHESDFSTVQDAAWDYYQTDAREIFSFSTARLAYLVRRLDRLGKVLNSGAGAGIFEELALRRGVEVYSLDPSERSLANLRASLRMAERAQVGYSQQIPFPDATCVMP